MFIFYFINIRLGGLLKTTNSDTQLTYKTLYCLWLLSYNDKIASQFHGTNVIQYIVDSIRNNPKEKIIRVGSAVLAVCIFILQYYFRIYYLHYFIVVILLEHHKQRRW